MTKAKTVTPFDTSQVNLVLSAIANAKPAGFKYVNPFGDPAGPDTGTSCYYVDQDGKGSCIVGTLAERLGIPLPPWGESANADGINDSVWFDPYFTQEALARLSTVQGRQDNGETWKRSIR